MTGAEVIVEPWWNQEPHRSLLLRLGKSPATFGNLAYNSPLWKSTAGRSKVWEALDQLTSTGLARRAAKGWVAAGELDALDDAFSEAELDYFDRLYRKAIEVGDIAEGDENFCGDCCYEYDDVLPADGDLMRSEAMAQVRLEAAPGTPPDVNLTASTVRYALGEGMLLVIVVPLIVVGVVSAFVWFALGWLAEGVVRIARRM